MMRNKQEHAQIPIIDFHSHILPGVDDGAENPEQSLEMLRMAKEQGVEKIVATPHFYPSREDPDILIARRNEAAKQLKGVLDDTVPDVYLGAEVLYFPQMGHTQETRKFCIEGTKLLLIEMPFNTWTDSIVEEVISVRHQLHLYPVIAHVERYLDFRALHFLPRLINEGVLVQTNSEYISDYTKKAESMVKKGYVHLIGSDMHNTTSRAPGWDKVNKISDRKVTRALLHGAYDYTSELLEDATLLKDLF